MEFWKSILSALDIKMETPEPYGWFHLLSFALAIGAAVLLCVTHKRGDDARVRRVVLTAAVISALLEIYKQVNFSFSYSGEAITFDFQWYAFPFQFCSIPMYVGLLTAIFRRGVIHRALIAFLGTYSIFAGLCVMLYPVQVYVDTIGINIQTMFCHGSMLTVGGYLLYTGYTPLKHKTILKALCVFGASVLLAVVMNEIAYASGLLESETFNMFFVSPYCEPSLPVYSIVQGIVPYPFCLIIYILGFTLAAYLILLLAMGIRRLALLWRGRKEVRG